MSSEPERSALFSEKSRPGLGWAPQGEAGSLPWIIYKVGPSELSAAALSPGGQPKMHSEPVPSAPPRLLGSLEAENPSSLGKEAVRLHMPRPSELGPLGLCRPAWAHGLPSHTRPPAHRTSSIPGFPVGSGLAAGVAKAMAPRGLWTCSRHAPACSPGGKKDGLT